MAKLIPKNDPSKIGNFGERSVIKSLLTLPEHVEIFHSRSFYILDGREKMSEGEIDIVVLDKQKGFLVIEVKGGTIQYNPQSKNFFRMEDQVKISDPFAQASKGLHALEQKIKEQYGDCNCRRGFAVAFPDCKEEVNTLLYDRSAILFYEDLNENLAKRVSDLLNVQPNAPVMSEGLYRAIKNILMGEFRCIRSLTRDIAEEEEAIVHATETQINAMSMFSRYSRAAFCGVAGSGKTMLALAQAISQAEQGKKVLFTCFNKDLSTFINMRKDLPEQLTVKNFHELGYELVIKKDVCWLDPGEDCNDDFWKKKFMGKVVRAIDKMSEAEKFESIIVDEAQDFQHVTFDAEAYDDWWIALRLLMKDPDRGSIWAFYDPRQCLYQSGVSLPIDLFSQPDKHFVLDENMRNTQKIAEHVKTLSMEINSSLSFKINSRIISGETPIELKVDSLEKLKKLIRDTVDGWMEGLHQTVSTITILAPRDSHEVVGEALKGVPLTKEISDWTTKRLVLLTSHGSFKGLESDFILDIEIPPLSAKRGYDPLIQRYVSHSRAKHRLVCIQYTGAWIA